jgi:hypothetical protein
VKRTVVRTGVALAAAVTTVVSAATAASAAPSTFVARAVHAGGRGAIAAAATGSLSWSTSERTVSFSHLTLFVKANECAYVEFFGYQGSNVVTDIYSLPPGDAHCAGANDETVALPDFALSTSVRGGIESAEILVHDVTHQVDGSTNCNRVRTNCTMG